MTDSRASTWVLSDCTSYKYYRLRASSGSSIAPHRSGGLGKLQLLFYHVALSPEEETSIACTLVLLKLGPETGSVRRGPNVLSHLTKTEIYVDDNLCKSVCFSTMELLRPRLYKLILWHWLDNLGQVVGMKGSSFLSCLAVCIQSIVQEIFIPYLERSKSLDTKVSVQI